MSSSLTSSESNYSAYWKEGQHAMTPLSSLCQAHRLNVLFYSRCLMQSGFERDKVMMSMVPSLETLSWISKVENSCKHYLMGCGIGGSHGLECCEFLFLIWVLHFLLVMSPKTLIIGYDYCYSWTKFPCTASSTVHAILSLDYFFYLILSPLYSLG